MASEFKQRRIVEFSDTDTAGIVHFSNFFCYMEQAEHAFLRSLGLSVHTRTLEGTIGFPRVSTHCDYVQPLHFEDEIEVCLRVREVTDKSITYDFLFRNLAHQPPVDAASGFIKVVCVLIGDGAEPMRAVSIPDQVTSKIEPVPPAR